MGIEENYLNIAKAKYDKHRANIILNGEKLKAFPLRSGTRQECPLLPVLFSIYLEVLAMAEQKKKRSPDWKRSKILTADDMILYKENPKDSISEN